MDPQQRAEYVETFMRLLVMHLQQSQRYVADATPDARAAVHEACIALADRIAELQKREGQ